MVRICIEKSTGKLIESQGGGEVDRRSRLEAETDEQYVEYIAACDNLEAMRLDTLKQNAINAGYTDSDIDVKWATNEELVVLLEMTSPKPTAIETRIIDGKKISELTKADFDKCSTVEELKAVISLILFGK